MSAFEKLLGELNAAQADTDTLAKSLPADDGKDDKKIQAAAGEGGEGDNKDGGDADEGGKSDGDDKPMAKSFKIKLEDGTEVDAEDGTALVKALTERLDATEGTFAKAMGQAVSLIQSQNAMIKSLGEQVAKLSGEGRGRKTMVSITEKTNAGDGKTLAKGGQGGTEGMTGEQFFAKANKAWENKLITGKDLTAIDVCLREQKPVDHALISKVLA